MRQISESDKAWLVGFTEGEGCFTIKLMPKQNKEHGIQCTLSFGITATDEKVIRKIKELIGFGHVNYAPKEYWIKHGLENSQDQWGYGVDSIEDCKKLIEILDENLFKGSKKINYLHWKEALKTFENGKYLTNKGVIQLAEIRDSMNRIKKSKNYHDKQFFENWCEKRKDPTPEQIEKRIKQSQKIIAYHQQNSAKKQIVSQCDKQEERKCIDCEANISESDPRTQWCPDCRKKHRSKIINEANKKRMSKNASDTNN